ncbi:MAG: ADP-ribosylglycohydrolase family protein [Bacteroidales bacterium]
MENARIGSEFYIGCMLGAALGNSMGSCCRQGKMAPGFTSSLHFEGLMQLAIFTAEGLLRATHRAKMHGTNGTFSEIVYESYQRWLKTQTFDYNDLVELPKNDGWLMRRSEMYYKGVPLKHTIGVLRKNKPGEIGKPINRLTDYEGLLRVFPVGLMFPGDAKLAFQVGAEICALTHGAPEAYVSAGFYAALIAELAKGALLPQAIESAMDLLDASEGAAKVRTAIIDILYLKDEVAEAEDSEKQGLIANYLKQNESAEAATQLLAFGLFCVLQNPDNYKECVLQAVRYKEAPHAAGMLAGSLSGLIHGETQLPEEWIANLKHRDIVIQIAEDLLTGIKGGIFIVDREWVAKYPGW